MTSLLQASRSFPQGAGLALGGVYISLVLLALHTPIRGALAAVFAPLGRMVLTNYIGATILMLIGGLILDLPHSTSWTATVLLAAGILIIQELLYGCATTHRGHLSIYGVE